MCDSYRNDVSYIYYESGPHCDLGGCLPDTQDLCSTSSKPVPVYNSDTSTPGYISVFNLVSVEQKFQTFPPGKTYSTVWPHQRCEDCPAGTFKPTYSSIPTAGDCVDCGACTFSTATGDSSISTCVLDQPGAGHESILSLFWDWVGRVSLRLGGAVLFFKSYFFYTGVPSIDDTRRMSKFVQFVRKLRVICLL
jgi:hypothetical protein